MPDRHQLKVGDTIRLLRVPQLDLDQRDRERREGREDPMDTVGTIERIIAEDPVVTICEIDEDGLPWFEREWPAADGGLERHSLAILEDESWEYVRSC